MRAAIPFVQTAVDNAVAASAALSVPLMSVFVVVVSTSVTRASVAAFCAVVKSIAELNANDDELSAYAPPVT